MGATKLLTAGGGGITLDAASTATDKTVTIPARTGNVAIDGPAFSAYLNGNQSVTVNVWTKVQLNTEVFDTNSCFDSTTNYRFTPTVAGYYQINAHIQWLMTSGVAIVGIFKNGSISAYGSYFEVISTNPHSHASTVLYLNGSSDYVELYGVYVTASSANYNGVSDQSASTYLSGVLVRAA